MRAIAATWPISPAINLRRLVRAGLLALVFALAADAEFFDASRDCRGGAFSSGLSRGFDVQRCSLTLKAVGADFKISVPLP